MNKLRPLLLFLFVFCFIKNGFAQKEQFNFPKHKIGMDIGYGTQAWLDLNYIYDVWLIQFQYSNALHSNTNWNIELLLQPQFNVAKFRDALEADLHTAYELGLNVGILLRSKFVNDAFYIYALISSGPHWVSNVPTRQSKGFIFSDNLFLGCNIKSGTNIYWDVRFGFRHMSNAGIQQPNGGINTIVSNIGFYYTL